MISEAQINWIFSKERELLERFAPRVPLSDAAWTELLAAAHELERKARCHPLVVQMTVAIIKYFEREEEQRCSGAAGADRGGDGLHPVSYGSL